MPANVIDSKVVEMKFDNSKFEKNVKDTMSTLDKLKLSLAKLTGKSTSLNIDTSDSNKGIQALGNSVESVASKFNALEAVAFGALAKIGSQAVVAGEQLLKSLTVDQISSGYSKYDEKTSSVQTLVNSTGKSVEEINKYLDQLMWYSDETSYSFTEMTSALAQMTSTGGDIDKLIPTITGIANATAYAGKNGEAFVHTIRNLTQSYNAGYLQLMDWKSLNLAGTSSKQLTEQLIKAAEELGTVQKGMLTVENFAEKLKNKDITTEVMDLAFSRFSAMSQEAYKLVSAGKFETASEAIEAIANDFDELAQRAFKSAQEAKSFTEAIDATKDAVSSGWMNTFEIIFGNYEQAKVLWTDLANGMWDFFAGGAEDRNNLLADVLGDNWDRITTRIEEAGIKTEDFERQMEIVASRAGLNTDTIIDYYGSMGEWLKQTGEKNSHFITETLYDMAYATKEIGDEFKITEKQLKSFDDIIEKMSKGKIKKSATALKELEKAGFKTAETQKMVNEFYETGGKNILKLQYDSDKLKESMIELSKSQVSYYGYSEEQISMLKDLATESNTAGTALNELKNRIGKEKENGRDLLFDAIGDSLMSLVDIIDIVKQAFSEIFPQQTAGMIYSIINRIREAARSMRDFLENENNAEKLTRVLKGLFAVLDIIKTIVGGALNVGFAVFKAILEELGFTVFDLTANISDNIVSFRDWLKEHIKTKEIIDKLIPKVKAFVKIIKSWFEEGGKLNKVLKVTKELLIKAKDAISEWFKEFGESDDKVTFIFEAIKRGLEEGLPELLSYAGELIAKLFDGITEFFTSEEEDNLKDTGKKAGNAFKEGFWLAMDRILYEFKDFGRTIIEKLKELPWEKIFAAGLAIATIYVLNKLSKWVDTLRSLLDPLNALIEEVRKTVKSFSKMMKQIGSSLNKEATGDMILKIAIAVGILVLSMKILDTLDADHIWQNVLVIIALLGALAIAIKVIGSVITKIVAIDPMKSVAVIASFVILIDALIIAMGVMTAMLVIFDHIKHPGKAIVLFMTLVAGLAILLGEVAVLSLTAKNGVKALLTLTLFVFVLSQAFVSMATALVAVSLIPDKNVWKAVAFCAIFAIFIGVFIALSVKITFAWIAAKAFAVGVLAIAGAMFLTALALKVFNQLDEDGVKKGIAFLIAYGVFLKILSKSVAGNAYGDTIKNFSKMAASLGIALFLTAIALKVIASMEVGELLKGIFFMGVFLGYIYLMSKITAAGGETVKGFGRLMVSLGVSLILMSIAMKILGNMKVNEIAKGLFAITMLALIMTVLIKSFKGFEKEAPKLMMSLIGAAISIGILALVVFLIGQLKVETLVKGLAAVGLLSLFVKGLIKATKECNPASTAAIVMLAVMVMTVAAALVILMIAADGDWKKLASAAVALGGVILALGLVLKSINGLTIDKSVMITLGILTGIMIAISLLLYLLATQPNPLGVLEAALGISLVLLAMAATLRILKGIQANDISNEAIIALAAISLIVGMVGLVLGELNNLGFEVGIKQAVALSVMLVAMAACLRIIAPIGALGTPLIEAAVLGLVTLVGGIGLVLELLAAGMLAVMLAASAVLPLFGLSIMAFWLAIKPFLDYVSTPEVTAAVNGIAAFCEGMESLVSAAFKDKIAGWLKVDIVEFANKFAKLGEPLGKFIDCIRLLNNSDLEKADIASQVLLKLCDLAGSLPTTGGLKGLIFGDSDFAQFIEDIGNLGPSIIKFSKNVGQITNVKLKGMENAIEAAKKIAELANALPSYGGKISEWFSGDKIQMSAFGTQITYFGSALASFSSSVSPGPSSKGVNKYYMDKAIDAGMRLGDLANKLPSTGGKIGEWFDGKNLDMGVFGTQLQLFGIALTLFSKESESISQDNLDKGITAAERLVDLAVALGGVTLGNAFTGKVATLGSLGPDLKKLGGALLTFNNSIKGVAITSMDMILPIVGRIVDILLQLSDFKAEDIDSFVSGVTALSTVEFDNLISGIKEMSNVGKGIIPESFGRFYDALNQIAGICMELSTIYVNGGKMPDLSLLGKYMQGFSEYLSTVQELAENTDFTLIGQVNGTISILSAILKNINDLNYENIETGIAALNELKQLDLNGIITALQVSEENQSMSINEGISPLMTTLATGIINGIDLVKGAFEQLFTTLLEYIPTKAFDFNTAAFHLMDSQHGGFSAGISKSKDTILYELKRIISSVVVEVKNDKYQDFYDMGNYFVKGLAAGIRENAVLAYNASKELANGVKTATQTGLQEKSPSKIARLFGQYWDEGLMLGIKDYEGQVYDTATHLSESTITGFKTAIDGIYDVIDWDMYPVITPTIDLSYVEAGTARINKLFENKKLKAEAEVQNGVNPAKDQPTYNFTQNNYSPKALSRIEIYRQTNNLISAARGR